jgi:hypothetical protein
VPGSPRALLAKPQGRSGRFCRLTTGNPETKEQFVSPKPEDLERPNSKEDLRSSSDTRKPGGLDASWVPLAGAVGGLAGATAIIYTVGGIVMWLRLNGAGVEANQALGAIPQQTLFAVGGEQLLWPAVVGAAIFFVAFLLERRQKRSAASASADGDGEAQNVAAVSADEKMTRPHSKYSALRDSVAKCFRMVGRSASRLWRSQGGTTLRRYIRLMLTPVVVPLKWYFKYVPAWLIAWLPILLFLPNPEQTVINAIVATCAVGIAEWAGQGARSAREAALRAGVGLVVLTTAAGLASELIHPHSLPRVAVEGTGHRMSAYFIAVSGGDAYLVQNSHLAIIPSSSYSRLVVTEGKTKNPHTPSIISDVWPW